MFRTINRVLTARPTSDGAGVKLSRVFGGEKTNKAFDPFLMLDEFASERASDYIGGFPSHPHRGFETVTYMLNGKMQHEDSLGNKGLLNGGDVQWMTAARGIIHSEMPQQHEGLMRGFQLWVNLPAKEKMKAPYYQDITATDIPEVETNGVYIKLIAGEVRLNGELVTGAITGLSTEPVYLDIHMKENSELNIPITDGHTALVYVYENEVGVGEGGSLIKAFDVASLSKKGEIKLMATAPAKLLVFAGKPIGEPIVQYGPFVMNTPQEIDQAIQDYRDGRFAS